MPTAPNAAPSADANRRARRRLPWGTLGLVAVLAVFAVGVTRLFELRFDVGDVYPPYSTLRSDPLGAKAFFESLGALPGLRVDRSLRPLSVLGTEPLRSADYDNGEKTFTCFYLGADASDWPYLLEPAAVQRLETVMRRGGRVVITFEPAQTSPSDESYDPFAPRKTERDTKRDRRGPTAKRVAEQRQPPDLIVRWGIDFRRRQAKSSSGHADGKPTGVAPSAWPRPAADAVEYAVPDPTAAARGGPDAAFAVGTEPVPWHSVLDFRTDTVPAMAARWHRLYDRRGRPVIVSRPFGTAGGELVLVSDSYFLSNEGLRNTVSPALLAALVGDGRRVIFDESHLGIEEAPGLMTLARRYRLQGALATVALLTVLFVWRNLISLVPLQTPSGTAGARETVLGHSADAGYLNLLRRSVRPRDLASVCAAQWEEGTTGPRKAAGGSISGNNAGVSPSERVRAVLAQEAALQARKRSPVAAVYRAMCAAAKRKE